MEIVGVGVGVAVLVVIGLFFVVQGLAVIESRRFIFRRRGSALQRLDAESVETMSVLMTGAGAILFLGAVAAVINPDALPVLVGVPLAVAAISAGLTARIVQGQAL